jgi:hypothetical protein
MIGDRKSEFKLKIKGKSEEKVRGYDARDVSLSHPRDCKPSLLLTRKLGLGISAHRADSRFRIEGLVPIRLVEEAQHFEVLLTRFDGTQCWYDGPDPRRDPGTAAYLRESLARMVEPSQLVRPGLTAEERVAYVLNYTTRLQAELEARRDRVEERLRAALAHAGAELREYQEWGDVYRVSYDVDGRRHGSIVARDDLSVQAAGICLSGQDGDFDLQSLVGVLREARGGGFDDDA